MRETDTLAQAGLYLMAEHIDEVVLFAFVLLGLFEPEALLLEQPQLRALEVRDVPREAPRVHELAVVPVDVAVDLDHLARAVLTRKLRLSLPRVNQTKRNNEFCCL